MDLLESHHSGHRPFDDTPWRCPAFRPPPCSDWKAPCVIHRFTELSTFQTPYTHPLPPGWKHIVSCEDLHPVCWVHLNADHWTRWSPTVLRCRLLIHQRPNWTGLSSGRRAFEHWWYTRGPNKYLSRPDLVSPQDVPQCHLPRLQAQPKP